MRKENNGQLQYGYESQRAVEQLQSQISTLRTAVSTMSDVLIGEMDSVRAEVRKQHDVCDVCHDDDYSPRMRDSLVWRRSR